MLNHVQLREHIINPCLMKLNYYCKSSEELLILTCAQESMGGTYIKQIDGPALGPFGMEPRTHDDIWHTYLVHHPELVFPLLNTLDYSRIPNAQQLMFNIAYAVMMCRIHYLRVPYPLPNHDDIENLAKYWKQHYNTELGKGTVEDAISNYNKFVGIKKNK